MLLLKLLKSVFITWNKGKIKYTYILDEYLYNFFLKWKLEMLPWQQLKEIKSWRTRITKHKTKKKLKAKHNYLK